MIINDCNEIRFLEYTLVTRVMWHESLDNHVIWHWCHKELISESCFVVKSYSDEIWTRIRRARWGTNLKILNCCENLMLWNLMLWDHGAKIVISAKQKICYLFLIALLDFQTRNNSLKTLSFTSLKISPWFLNGLFWPYLAYIWSRWPRMTHYYEQLPIVLEQAGPN